VLLRWWAILALDTREKVVAWLKKYSTKDLHRLALLTADSGLAGDRTNLLEGDDICVLPFIPPPHPVEESNSDAESDSTNDDIFDATESELILNNPVKAHCRLVAEEAANVARLIWMDECMYNFVQLDFCDLVRSNAYVPAVLFETYKEMPTRWFAKLAGPLIKAFDFMFPAPQESAINGLLLAISQLHRGALEYFNGPCDWEFASANDAESAPDIEDLGSSLQCFLAYQLHDARSVSHRMSSKLDRDNVNGWPVFTAWQEEVSKTPLPIRLVDNPVEFAERIALLTPREAVWGYVEQGLFHSPPPQESLNCSNGCRIQPYALIRDAHCPVCHEPMRAGMHLVLSTIANLIRRKSTEEGRTVITNALYLDWLYSLFYPGADARDFASDIPLFFQRWAMLMFLECEYATLRAKKVSGFAATGVVTIYILPTRIHCAILRGLCYTLAHASDDPVRAAMATWIKRYVRIKGSITDMTGSQNAHFFWDYFSTPELLEFLCREFPDFLPITVWQTQRIQLLDLAMLFASIPRIPLYEWLNTRGLLDLVTEAEQALADRVLADDDAAAAWILEHNPAITVETVNVALGGPSYTQTGKTSAFVRGWRLSTQQRGE
jgi:hypothetical protein